MAELKGNHNVLVAARTLLMNSLQNSKATATNLDETAKKVDQIRQRLANLNDTLWQKCSCSSIKDQIDGAVCPAMAVVEVCKSIRELEKALVFNNPHSDVRAYLLLIKQFEQALKFLSDNCGLAIQWLVQFLDENKVSYAYKVEMCLRIVRKIQDSHVNGEILCVAFDKLEDEFEQLLAVAPSIIVNLKLQAIAAKLNDNNKLDWCLAAYIEVRSRVAKTSLEALDLNYLDMSVTKVDDVQDIGCFIDQWCEHFHFAVKQILEAEYELCIQVFDTFNSNVCFAKIATQSGIISLLHFGAKVTECKKDPVKLLKLLDIFSTLDSLREDFNRLFIGKACGEIQNLTRILIRKVVCGVCEIFWELPYQVELQRPSSPPSDGGVPRLISFVTEYCNHLLGDDYKSLLIKVVTIYQSWKNDKYQETVVSRQITAIMKEMCMNLDTWSKTYEDKAMSYLFMMNNHCHFSNMKGTPVGEMMGNCWITGHERYKDYYMRLYLKETWGNIIYLLSQEDDDSVTTKKKISLEAFNEALEGMYEKQSELVVPNEELRLRLCGMAVQALVPLYRIYLQSFTHADVKYTSQGFETMLINWWL
ncbi:exocyst complex component EXO70I-like [Mercurialis annua]|uniref:exocyst complex component EXO70I-like n=1 Tax=Mercurialis annua TaxID=3986 RepID=UPI002160B4C5|nr:exocyst complex component EXO70I-like [Mercurialis annua]